MSVHEHEHEPMPEPPAEASAENPPPVQPFFVEATDTSVSPEPRPRDAEDRVEFFVKSGKAGKLVWWRFRAAGNSAVMGGPAEGYADLDAALAGARRVVGRDLVFADREVAADGREIRAYAEDGLEPPELHTLPPAPPVD